MQIDRRKLNELKARYALEPTIRDIYVEGPSDERFIRYVLRSLSVKDVMVSRVDLLHVPDELLAREGFTRGEKSELLAAAIEIERDVGPTSCFTAVIDADSDRLLGEAAVPGLALVTDYTCMEMYWLTEGTVSKLSDLLGIAELNLDMLKNIIYQPVVELFLIRAAARSLQLSLSIRPFTRYLVLRDGALILDQQEYISMILNASGLRRSEEAFTNRILELRQTLDSDLRHAAQGHDLFSAIVFALKRVLANAGLREEHGIINALWLCVDVSEVKTEQLFTSLAERCCN